MMEHRPMEIDKAAEIFPLMGEVEFQALKEDIQRNGQREPVVLYQDRILDGRNRYRACRELGVEVKSVEWAGEGSPVDFVVSMNLHRRHLNETQRAEIAARLATRRPGKQPNASIDALTPTQNEAAALMNVSRKSVQRAKKRLAENKREPVPGQPEQSESASPRRKGARGEMRKTTIPMRPNEAARVICERWPRSMIDELIEALQKRRQQLK